ncbi:hypothetical protein PC121_g7092 [Phytophthora cactorum]|nr:hypothetical protein PC121_g7092 [Phytophthora cactorum]KAG4060030.1 hypothetical protein PC123_g5035 [Phytophthora cactorum]
MEAAPTETPEPPPPNTALQEAEAAAVEALIDSALLHTKKRRKHYSIKQKREALRTTAGLRQRDAASSQGVPRWTLTSWRKKQDAIYSFQGSEKTLSRAPGRREIVLFGIELITFMKDTRRDCHVLTAAIMASYVRDEHPDWLHRYVEDKKNASTAYESLLRLMRQFAYRYGFVQRTPNALKKLDDLVAVQEEFAQLFKVNYRSYNASEVFNTDETGIYFDMSPAKILSPKGKAAPITAQQKNSARLTAVCTIRADGVKLPLLFIVRGEPNGTIERDELPTYPKGHIYTVQKKARMDSRVWRFYLRSLLQWHIREPSILLIDNLECHISDEAEAIVAGELVSVLQPLPKNSTSVCQPLDVGVMGPLKAKLKALWLVEKTTATTASKKRLATIKRTIKTWESIEPETITKVFNKALKTNFLAK